MSRTSGNLMSAVAGFLHRKTTDFTSGTWDNLLQAVNNARMQTERLIDFELARVSVDIPNVSLTDGGSILNAVLHSNGTTPVSVKKIIVPFLAFTQAGQGTFPVGLISRDRWLDRQRRRFENARPEDLVNGKIPTNTPFSVHQNGNLIYVTPNDTSFFSGSSTVTVYADAYKWLPDYGTTVKTGTATGTTANKLVASAGSFITNLISIGAVVTNSTTGATALVLAVDSAVQLTLSADVFVSGNSYSIPTANENDFLLDFCFDWLMYAAVEELNFYLKEDERVSLSKEVTQRAWEGVVRWNSNFIRQGTEDTKLD